MILKGENGYSLIFKDGEAIEGADEPIFPYDEKKPNCPWSRIEASELHRTNGKFEAHFLVENSSELSETHLWYLTLRGSDIRERDCILK